jgi:DNA-directed RNA polymerase specialized sigma subunit
LFSDEFNPDKDIDTSVKAWQMDRTPEMSAKTLDTLRPTIDKAVRTHVPNPSPLVASKARRLTLDAMESYDPSRGRFQTHLYSHLRGLKRYAVQSGQPVRVPERIMLDRKAVDFAVNALTDELGREPTDNEISKLTGFSAKRLQKVRGFGTPMAEGFFSTVGDSEAGGMTPGVVRDASDAWLRFVYDDLPPMDQKIMEWSLGLNGHKRLSNQEIARRLNRSPGAVSQRKAAIQNALNQEEALSPFR